MIKPFDSGLKRVLVVNAHADDMEFGCGGTVARLVEGGVEVYSLVLSLRRKTVAEGFPTDELVRETLAAGRELGLPEEQILICDYEHRIFPQLRQVILDEIYRRARELEPDLVFTTSLDDTHQDHIVTARETFRALKYTNIVSFSFPWNTLVKRVNLYSEVHEEHLAKKIRALECYETQIPGRAYFDPEYLRAQAISWGTNIRVRYAEHFEIVRWLWR